MGVPREVFPNERRVALTPQNVALLRKKGFAEVLVERDAGMHAQFLNEDYEKAGATLTSREQLFAKAVIIESVAIDLSLLPTDKPLQDDNEGVSSG